MPTKPQVLKRQLIARSRIFRVEELQLQFANGETRTYERLLSDHRAVIMVPMLDNHRVILVREYAAGMESYQWALPKGKVDPGETFEEAANRELQEEIGYAAGRLTCLKYLTQSPNYMQHGTQLVLAQELYAQTALGDEPEPLQTQVVELADLEALCLREDFSEARSVAALFLVRAHLAAQG
jgi:ADP-ribose diphosphatase